MKVAHLTSVHTTFDNRIFHKECKSLMASGHEVVLIATHPRSETIEGVKVIGLGRPRDRMSRLLSTVPSLFRAAWRERADLYHFHDPELIPVGLLLKSLGRRVVYDVHEDVPKQILSKLWISPRLRRVIAFATAGAEKVASVALDGIVMANPGTLPRFPQSKTILVQNFPLPGELDNIDLSSYPTRGFHAAYVGGLTEGRGLEGMIAAIDRLRHWPGARLLLGGEFQPRALEDTAKTLPGWGLVDWRGWQSRSQVAAMLSQARVGLVVLQPIPNHLVIQPTKIFEYMAAGLPVVYSDFPHWRALVDQAQCGIAVDPLDSNAIADAIDRIFRDPEAARAMGLRGREFVRAHYSWATESDRLSRFYDRIVGQSAH